jgi:hypothetical protein
MNQIQSDSRAHIHVACPVVLLPEPNQGFSPTTQTPSQFDIDVTGCEVSQ